VRTSFLIAVAVASSFAVLGCEDKKQTPAAPSATASAPSTTAQASASAAPSAAPSAQVAKNAHLAHCPNAVEGAKTDIKDTIDGIELTITATDAAKTAEIRARSKALVDAAKNPDLQQKHTGGGGGQGFSGRCPVVIRNTALTLAEVDGGSKFTVKPNDKMELDWLRQQTRERQDTLAATLSGDDAGAGTKHMVHCPSAVEGATTAVKDTKDGVVVTVTAKTADATTEIRARAKHVVDIMKHDAGAVAHTGEGTGGHNLGRCPSVIKDTTVDSKEVPNGAELTVKAKSVNDVLKVQKEAKQRAERWTAPAASGSASAAPSASAPPKPPK
jgi:hypothetical protein